MKPHPPHTRAVCCLALVAGLMLAPSPAAADQRFIVRAAAGLDGLATVNGVCGLVGCSVQYSLDGSLNQVFLVTTDDTSDPVSFVTMLRTLAGIEDAEIDQIVKTLGGQGDEVPPALLDDEPIEYFGVTVRGGYVRQRAAEILGIAEAQARYSGTGRGVQVAVIDTGVDHNHPVLRNVLAPGYDFTRGQDSGSELSDLTQSTMTVLDDARPGWVNQSTMTVLDQSTMTVLDNPEYAAFGHGTMVAGIVHLVAPGATILPLKAFRADGSGYTSDVLRAIYFAMRAEAKVINMSFSYATLSRELQRALDFATARGMVPIGSAGNGGQQISVYPAALPNVIGVASTTAFDTLSDFSNFGPEVAWVAAPGEAIVTVYPFGTYAAAWGTSFSAPFASGAAALLAEVGSQITTAQAHEAEGHAVWISVDVSRGRLDIPAAIQAWRATLGLD